MPRVNATRRNIPDLIAQRIPFRNSTGSLWAEQHGARYIIFSYRRSWPLAIIDAGRALVNTKRYSATTSQHLGRVRYSLSIARIPMQETDTAGILRALTATEPA